GGGTCSLVSASRESTKRWIESRERLSRCWSIRFSTVRDPGASAGEGAALPATPVKRTSQIARATSAARPGRFAKSQKYLASPSQTLSPIHPPPFHAGNLVHLNGT